MKLGYDLTIKQSQNLVMTPELIQAIQILQFNTQELEGYVQEQLLTNPLLENDNSPEPAKGEDTTEKLEELKLEVPSVTGNESETTEKEWQENLVERYDDISYKQWEYKPESEEYSYEQYTCAEVTLSEHLLFQLQFAEMSKSCRTIGKYIIESLDDNGYMTLTVEEIARVVKSSTENIEKVLDVIQGFDPSGVGARDLKECLLIQLKNKGELTSDAEKVILFHLEDIASNRLNLISKELGITSKEVQHIGDIIRGLEPKPGREFGCQTSTRYIVPDVIVEKVEAEYVVTINETSTPRLTISSYYQKMMKNSDGDENLSKFLSGRYNSAVWLIKSIEQRKQTIYNVVKAVVKYQREFFDCGSKHLKTLTLKQIAEDVGIHESTVSRSINGKYMQTPRGVYEIKYFFTSGVPDDHGGSISSSSIKEFIKEIITGEDHSSPYSDQDMVTMLGEKGIELSRRTVAKYRDELKIPSSSKRKRY